jgi:hypothetical protein
MSSGDSAEAVDDEYQSAKGASGPIIIPTTITAPKGAKADSEGAQRRQQRRHRDEQHGGASRRQPEGRNKKINQEQERRRRPDALEQGGLHICDRRDRESEGAAADPAQEDQRQQKGWRHPAWRRWRPAANLLVDASSLVRPPLT